MSHSIGECSDSGCPEHVGPPPKYPNVTVDLSRYHGANAVVLVMVVRRALRDAGVDYDELHRFQDEALASDLYSTIYRWVNVT